MNILIQRHLIFIWNVTQIGADSILIYCLKYLEGLLRSIIIIVSPKALICLQQIFLRKVLTSINWAYRNALERFWVVLCDVVKVLYFFSCYKQSLSVAGCLYRLQAISFHNSTFRSKVFGLAGILWRLLRHSCTKKTKKFTCFWYNGNGFSGANNHVVRRIWKTEFLLQWDNDTKYNEHCFQKGTV